jgi:hypothetical protein
MQTAGHLADSSLYYRYTDGMDEKGARQYANEMADCVAAAYKSAQAHVGDDRITQFRDAAFDHLSEFIPDGAVAVVVSVTEAEGLPTFLAVHGKSVYRLVFRPFEFGSAEPPVTVCKHFCLTAHASVEVAAEYSSSPEPPAPRTTEWAFRLTEKDGFSFLSEHIPGRRLSDTEQFGRALATEIGWSELQVDE